MRFVRVIQIYAALLAWFYLVDCQRQQQQEVVYQVPIRVPHRRDLQIKTSVYYILGFVVLGNAILGTQTRTGISIQDGHGGSAGGDSNGPSPT